MFSKVTEMSFRALSQQDGLQDTETFATHIWFGSASRCTKSTKTVPQLHQLLIHCCLKLVATRRKTSTRKNKTRLYRTDDGFHPLQLPNQTIVEISISTCTFSRLHICPRDIFMLFLFASWFVILREETNSGPFQVDPTGLVWNRPAFYLRVVQSVFCSNYRQRRSDFL